MTVEFKTPDMGSDIPQVLSYLYQLANQLNYAFSILENTTPGQVDGGGQQSATRNLVNQKFGQLSTRINGLDGTIGMHGRQLAEIGSAMEIRKDENGHVTGLNLKVGLQINGVDLDTYIRSIIEEA